MSNIVGERKPVIPCKSSLEILSELFSKFDAEPPVIVKKEKSEDSSKKHKKNKKKKEHKHKKHKKSKKRKQSRSISTSSESESSGIDLTELLIKRELDRCVEVEPNGGIKIKLDTEITKNVNEVKPKSDNTNKSAGSDNDSEGIPPALKESKFSSIFHVALQTLQERKKINREEQARDVAENTDDKRKDEDVKMDYEMDQNEETNKDLSKSDKSGCAIVDSDSVNNKNTIPQANPSKNLKTDAKNETILKHKISPIIFNSEDISNESKDRKFNKLKKADSSKRKEGNKVIRDNNQDKYRHKDRESRHKDGHRRDRDSHRRSGESHRRDGDSSHHKYPDRDGRSSSHRHNDRDLKRRRRERRRDDDNDFYRKTDEFRSSNKRKRRSPSPDRITGFSQGNLVSTRLGNPFYSKTSNENKHSSYFLGTRSPPPALRPSDKEDRWSIRERFRRQASEASGGSSGGSNIGIDKKKLLEIARKNAVQMIKSGSLPEALKLGPQAQEKVLAAIRSGGKTVDELTDFCRSLSRKEELGELSSLSDGETRSDGPESDVEHAFHHPFLLKERPQSITVNIKNSVPLPIKATTERPTGELHLQFPVSSGQLHRKTESEWMPVEPLTPPVVAPQSKPPEKIDLAIAAIAANSPFATPAPPIPISKSIVAALIQPPPPPPAPPTFLATPLPVPPIAFNAGPPIMPIINPTPTASIRKQQGVVIPPPLPPPLPPPMLLPPSPPMGFLTMVKEQPLVVPPQPPVPGVNETSEQIVGPTVEQIMEQQKVDVASIVAQRLTAMRKLQENPNDVQAISEIYKAQKEMNFWAECKQQFGQFTGSTGAQIMSQAELNSGYQAWARKDQLQTAAPLTGGMGMHLLQKMGWRPGEGLGKEKTGTLEPLLLEVKLDKKGVVAKEEVKGVRSARGTNAAASKAGPSTVKQAVKVMQGKHPVSLLSEYASKKRLGPVEYSLCFECGPDHKKNFLFKVVLNGVEFKPNIACGNKKEAKALAAQVCLQQIGMLPHVTSGSGQLDPTM